jgi:hypothetical protein
MFRTPFFLSRITTQVKPKLPSDFEETTWQKLQEAIVAVQKKIPVNCSLEELYKVRMSVVFIAHCDV